MLNRMKAPSQTLGSLVRDLRTPVLADELHETGHVGRSNLAPCLRARHHVLADGALTRVASDVHDKRLGVVDDLRIHGDEARRPRKESADALAVGEQPPLHLPYRHTQTHP